MGAEAGVGREMRMKWNRITIHPSAHGLGNEKVTKVPHP